MPYFKVKCTEFDPGWGSAPYPAGELTAFPRLLSQFKGPTRLLLRRRRGAEGMGRERK